MTTGGASGGPLVYAGSGAGTGCASAWEAGGASNAVSVDTETARVPPARNGGRNASRRAAGNGGDGSARTKTAAASGSRGRAAKPAGSISSDRSEDRRVGEEW